MSSSIKVRALQESDIDLFVNYFHGLSMEELATMGIDQSSLPAASIMRDGLRNPGRDSAGRLLSGILIWELEGRAVGMNTLKDIDYEQKTGHMHLHMWDPELRGKGLGRSFFCMAALTFYSQFDLERIVCEPRSANPAPNRMLTNIGFKCVATYEGRSSAISDVCELNQYLVDRKTCMAFLAKNKF